MEDGFNIPKKYLIANMLDAIAKIEKGYKRNAFSDAATALRAVSEEKFIEYSENKDFTPVHSIGKSVNECIIEYLETGKMSRLDNADIKNY